MAGLNNHVLHWRPEENRWVAIGSQAVAPTTRSRFLVAPLAGQSLASVSAPLSEEVTSS
jgi:hypothetical protein